MSLAALNICFQDAADLMPTSGMEFIFQTKWFFLAKKYSHWFL